MSKICDIFGVPMVTSFRVGIEYEVESVAKVASNEKYILNCTNDDSLRNHGIEVITRPLPYQDALDSHLWLFSEGLVFHKKQDACTELGSIHVHVNFSDVELDKVRQFIRLYALLEPLFFNAVADHRQNNIYCVPVSATNILKYVNAEVGEMVERWHKYCAFNVKPLSQYGTIEFRHLQITDDHAVFETWLRMIHELYQFNKTNDAPPVLSPSFLRKLVVAVTGSPFLTDEDISVKLEQTQINDLLLTVAPTNAVLNARLKAKEVA